VSGSNPYDGSAVQVVPLPVERIPVFHWRPGSRALVVGSRDGAVYDADWLAAEERTFRRPVDAALLATAAERGRCTAVTAAWSESLRFPQGLDLLRSMNLPMIVTTAGRGDPEVVAHLLTQVTAWLVLVHRQPGEHVRTICDRGAHVEVQLALDDDIIVPDLPWSQVKAVHLVPRRPADDPTARREWYNEARAALPRGLPIYDEDHPHSDCACGARLMWRSGGASRRDGLGVDGRCTECGKIAGFTH